MTDIYTLVAIVVFVLLTSFTKYDAIADMRYETLYIADMGMLTENSWTTEHPPTKEKTLVYFGDTYTVESISDYFIEGESEYDVIYNAVYLRRVK